MKPMTKDARMRKLILAITMHAWADTAHPSAPSTIFGDPTHTTCVFSRVPRNHSASRTTGVIA
jgi:hypothetical protein